IAHEDASDRMLPYARLLSDAMRGDPTLFNRQDAVRRLGGLSIRFWEMSLRCMNTSPIPGVQLRQMQSLRISEAGTIPGHAKNFLHGYRGDFEVAVVEPCEKMRRQIASVLPRPHPDPLQGSGPFQLFQ